MTLAPKPASPILNEQAQQATAVVEAAWEREWPAANPGPDLGCFPEGTPMRTMRGMRLVAALADLNAILVGSLNPEVWDGTSAHTRPKDKEMPATRLVRTAEHGFEPIVFGTREETRRTTSRILRMHANVVGTKEDGTEAALRQDNLLWVWACRTNSLFAMSDRLAPQSDDKRQEAYQQEVLHGELYGQSRDSVPPTVEEFQADFEEELRSPKLYLTDTSRKMGLEMGLNMPIFGLPLFAREIMNDVLIDALPEPAREKFGIEYNEDQRKTAERTIKIAAWLNKILPDAITTGRNHALYRLVEYGEIWRWIVGTQAQLPEAATA